MRLLLSVYGRKAERAACLARLSWPAVRACCPALCRCFISTLRFFGSSSPVTFLLLFSTFHHAVTFFRYVPFLPLFVMFLLLVTFLLKREPIPLYSPYSLLSIYPPYSPPFLPFPPCFPLFPPFGLFPMVLRGFSVCSGGPGLVRAERGAQAVTLAYWQRSRRRSCLLRLFLLSFSAVLVPSFRASFPSALVRCPSVRFSGLVFFARAGRGRSAAERTKSGAAALVRRCRSLACVLFSGRKGQDDYCGADQAINRCSHIVKLLCGRRLGAAGLFRGQAL